MNAVFINHSNHPVARWSVEQKAAAQAYGDVVDLPFPAIPANASEDDVTAMVAQSLERILSLKPTAVMCQGEFTYSYLLIHQLLMHGITVLAACSERVVSEYTDEHGASQKRASFTFCRFRQFTEHLSEGGI